MWNKPTKEELSQLPAFYETEEIPFKDKQVHMHFFIGACDWYVLEFDGEDQFFGFVILNGDYEMAELGHFSLSELSSIRVGGILEIDRDLYWDVRKASEIKKICKAKGWHLTDTTKVRGAHGIHT